MERAAAEMTRAGQLYEQLAANRPAEFAAVLAQLRADQVDLEDLARRQRDALERLLYSTRPLVDAAASVARGSGGAGAGRRLDRNLTELADDPQWTALVAVIRRIIAGDTDPRVLDDLDPAQAAATAAVLDRLRD